MCAMPMVPQSGAWTVDDLDDLPDDGLQYELADGVLLVTPSPQVRHQRAVVRLAALLLTACPSDFEVFVAPLDFRPTQATSLQPDVLVVRREDAQGSVLTGTPLLVVEVLSPSTRAKDLVLKRALYAESGVPSYWVVDPVEESVLVLDLRGQDYLEISRVRGTEPVALELPFPLVLQPAAMLR